MLQLKLSTDTFDQDNTFLIEFNTRRGLTDSRKCSLHRDYEKQGDGIYWGMSTGSCVKSHYTEKDHQEWDRLGSGAYTVRNGDVVEIDGREYRARVNGAYSDAVIFDLVA